MFIVSKIKLCVFSIDHFQYFLVFLVDFIFQHERLNNPSDNSDINKTTYCIQKPKSDFVCVQIMKSEKPQRPCWSHVQFSAIVFVHDLVLFLFWQLANLFFDNYLLFHTYIFEKIKTIWIYIDIFLCLICVVFSSFPAFLTVWSFVICDKNIHNWKFSSNSKTILIFLCIFSNALQASMFF